MRRDRLPWAAYLIEAASLALFMVSALTWTVLLEHPASALRDHIASPTVRRAVIGIAMGLTAATIIYSPWGRRSGAHINPAVTLTFLRLRKVRPRDAAAYVVAQFCGAVAGVIVIALPWPQVVSVPTVNYVATVPGAPGLAVALVAEIAISFGMMLMILNVSNVPRLARYTGAIAAVMIAFYITVEAPLSGMSMNPARSFAPALMAGAVAPLWIYFVGPLAGMLLAAEFYVRHRGHGSVRCAKLHHAASGPCHFTCTAESRTA